MKILHNNKLKYSNQFVLNKYIYVQAIFTQVNYIHGSLFIAKQLTIDVIRLKSLQPCSRRIRALNIMINIIFCNKTKIHKFSHDIQ